MGLNLDIQEFKSLASQYSVVPLFRKIVAPEETPLTVFEKLAIDKRGSFLLESAEAGVWSRYSFIGVNNRGTLIKETNGDTEWVSLNNQSPFPFANGQPIPGGALDAIEKVGSSWQSPKLANLPPLTSGLVGMLAWDLIREIEDLPNPPAHDYQTPLMNLSMTSDMVIVDHHEGELLLLANAFIDEGADLDSLYQDAEFRIQTLWNGLTKPFATVPKEIANQSNLEARHRVSKEDFFAALEKSKHYVQIGDVFQVVLSQRFDIETDATSLDIYRMLRKLNPSPYMYLLNFEDASGGFAVIGSSPEALVTVQSGHAVMHPIAGSRPRGKNEAEDTRLAEALVLDAKERAEHLMLVDLARNDLLKVCEPETVQVSEFMKIHKFSHIMHLNSTVEGKVRAGQSPVDVFRATFPAGTLSGAPKPRALEIIDELEPANRGLYAGVVGYFDFVGNADLAIAIRTAFLRDGVARVQAGAGIVLDSVFESEYQETISKASAPLRAVIEASET